MTDTGHDPLHHARLLLSETREELARADGKASLLLSAMTVAISLSIGAIGDTRWSPSHLQSSWEVAWWVAVLGAGGAVLALALAVVPRTRHDLHRSNLYYFGHVVRYRPSRLGFLRLNAPATQQFMDDALNPPAPLDRTLDQVWVLSGSVHRKFLLIRLSMILTALASTLAALSVACGQ